MNPSRIAAAIAVLVAGALPVPAGGAEPAPRGAPGAGAAAAAPAAPAAEVPLVPLVPSSTVAPAAGAETDHRVLRAWEMKDDPSAATAASGGAAPGAAAVPAGFEPFAVGVMVDLLVPAGQVSTTYAFDLQLRWRMPFHGNRVALAADAGWFPLEGSGEQADPQLGVYSFQWSVHSIPVFLGVEYMLPLSDLVPALSGAPPFDSLRPFGEAGFAMSFLSSSATYTSASGVVFSADNPSSGFGTGYYLGLGGALRLGPGDLVASYRHASFYTDMGLPWINQESGDVGGTNVYAGYRFVF